MVIQNLNKRKQSVLVATPEKKKVQKMKITNCMNSSKYVKGTYKPEKGDGKISKPLKNSRNLMTLKSLCLY